MRTRLKRSTHVLRLLYLIVPSVAALSLAACSSDGADRARMTVAPTEAATTTDPALVPPVPPAPSTPGAQPPASGEPVASTAAIPEDELPVVEFAVGGVIIAALGLEVPPREEYGIGLSGRTTLGERGMLFDYGVPDHLGPFWMKNTHVDLDIAFVGADARIVAIRQMEAEALDLVESGAPYQWAIEAPSGWYEAHGIEVGAEVLFRFDTPSALAAP